MALKFSKTKFKNFLPNTKTVEEAQTFLFDLQWCSIFIAIQSSDRGAPISVPLFPCPLITVAGRCPEADASPADCHERKIYLHWLLYIQWLLKPGKKTTAVILASKQLKSTGAGSVHSPKINMTWKERGLENKERCFSFREIYFF